MTRPGGSWPTLAEVVVESSIDGFAAMDREGRYTLWNRAMARFAGVAAEEVLGRQAFEVFPHLRDLGLEDAFRRALAGEIVATDGVEHVEPDGARRVYDRLYVPLRSGGDGAIDGVLAIVRDATSRYAAVDALKEREAQLRMAVEAGEVGLWAWDPATDVIAWEDTMCPIFGVAPGHAPTTREEYFAFIHPDDRDASLARLRRSAAPREWSDEYRVVRPDGAVRWVMSKARFLRVEGHELVLGVVFDVTDRKEREDRKRAAQKLETIGQLTAGIAHNFNNMLMSLMPNLEVAVRRAPADLAPLLRDAERAAQSAADVVQQLMTYVGGNRKAARRVEAIGPMVERTVAFSRTTFDARIALDVRCDEALAAVLDATQVEQALLNMLINARDALSSAAVPAPAITVEARRVPPGAPELEGRPGEWACVRVRDNGVGMSPETVQRIYEPFFTTKGKGTGLGLATAHGVLRDHGGFITCESSPGRGTVFSLYLPAAGDAARPEAHRSPSLAPASSPGGSKATVLVVDDEPAIRKVVALVLEDAGFEVVTAGSGEDALRTLAETGRVGIILLDVSMPGMPSAVLRERLREQVPEVPVVYLTGYARQAVDDDAVLEKPLTSEQLIEGVERALEGRRVSRSA